VALLDETLDEPGFHALVRACLDAHPALRLIENRAAQRFEPAKGSDLVARLCHYETRATLTDDPAAYLGPRPDLFDDPTLPPFRAACHVAARPARIDPDSAARAPAAVLVFVASHSMLEGADLAAVLRGRDRTRPQISPRKLRLAVRLGLAVVAPVLALVHAALAKRESRKPQDFAFATVELARADVARAAREMGLRKRSLLFALALYTIAGDKVGRRQSAVYSTLPREHVRLEDDSVLSVRTHFLSFRAPRPLRDYARRLDRELTRQNETELVSQFLGNRLLSLHRRLILWLPALYRGAFFGFAPNDMVLSLVTPVLPGPPFDALAQARLFGATYSGTVPSVIYLWTARSVTMGCWLEKSRHGDLARLVESCAELGIAVRVSTRPAGDAAGHVVADGGAPGGDGTASPA
jgi:hypothetical protein